MQASRNRMVKTALALSHLAHSGWLMRRTLALLYNDRIVRGGSIPSVDLGDLLGVVPEVTLVDFVSAAGNVSAFELLCLCTLVRALRPRQLLELGTFNGNTTLQLAANLAIGAKLVTVDLPLDAGPTSANNQHDAVLITAPLRRQPRYLQSPYGQRVEQRFGNTLQLDFSSLCESAPDFVFIDAGHTDECVRNDSRKSLDVLAPGGTIVWHDYTQDWPDVYDYLGELSTELPIVRLESTNLVVHRDTRPR